MKQTYLGKLSWLMSFVLLSCFLSNAEMKVPCLIFSGNADTEHSIDLAKLNRISFGDNSMVISSSKENGEEPVTLLYELYHHLEIGHADPTNVDTGVEAIDADSDSRIFVDSKSKLLHLQCPDESEFSIGVFNLNGNLLLTSDLKKGDAVTLEALTPGVYVAVATDGTTKLSLKFILN